jgi:hypothetical protein
MFPVTVRPFAYRELAHLYCELANATSDVRSRRELRDPALTDLGWQLARAIIAQIAGRSRWPQTRCSVTQKRPLVRSLDWFKDFWR